MKIVLILTVAALSIVIGSCGVSDKRETLKGKWELTDVTYNWGDTAGIGGLDRERIVDKVKMYKEAINQNRGQVFMQLEDSTYFRTTPSNETPGKWKLMADDSTVHFQSSDSRGGNYEQIIRKLDTETLHLYDSRESIIIVYKKAK